MTNFTAARIHMVDSQSHTMGVVTESILNAYRTIPREEFVPEGRKGVAYCDEDMPIGAGRCLMEPVTHARLMQAANPAVTDTVLDIGGASGYSPAILSKIAGRVVALEQDASLLAHAESSWAKLGKTNIIPHQGPFAEGEAEYGPYDLIFVNGSVCELPQSWLDQLAVNGKLVVVIRKADDKIGRAMLYMKSQHGTISDRVLFDAAVPYLPGFEPRRAFVF